MANKFLKDLEAHLSSLDQDEIEQFQKWVTLASEYKKDMPYSNALVKAYFEIYVNDEPQTTIDFVVPSLGEIPIIKCQDLDWNLEEDEKDF